MSVKASTSNTKDVKQKLGATSYKQAMFLTSDAYITVFGGSAGAGKSQTGLIRFLKYVNDPEFVGYVFRKNASDLRGSGALFDKAVKLLNNTTVG